MDVQLAVVATIFVGAILGALVGFGIGMIMLPGQLLAGTSLTATVFAILVVGGLTRLPDAWRARRTFDRSRVLPLLLGSVPGTLAGLMIRNHMDARWLQIGAGFATLASVVAMVAMGVKRQASPPSSGAFLRAGLLGGTLGPTTSLSGIPPALAYARGQIEARQTIEELSIYFVIGNTLMLLALTSSLRELPLAPFTLVLWVVCAQVGTAIGTRYAARVSQTVFRALTLIMAAVAGVACLAQAL